MILRSRGEEFVVILPGTSEAVTRQRAEELCAAVKHLSSQYDWAIAGNNYPLLSLGVATFPEHATTAAGLIKPANAAFYQARREGCDRVVGATGKVAEPCPQ